MNYLFKLYKFHILIVLSILSLFFWALTSSLWALNQKKSKILVVERKCDSSITITNPLLDKEHRFIQSFLYQFIALTFNFNHKNYKENMKKSGSLMSLNLWNKKKKEIVKVYEQIKDKNFHQTFEIINLEKIKQDKFLLELKTFYHKKGINLKDQIKVTIFIQKTKIREDNSWGIEVKSYEIQNL